MARGKFGALALQSKVPSPAEIGDLLDRIDDLCEQEFGNKFVHPYLLPIETYAEGYGAVSDRDEITTAIILAPTREKVKRIQFSGSTKTFKLNPDPTGYDDVLQATGTALHVIKQKQLKGWVASTGGASGSYTVAFHKNYKDLIPGLQNIGGNLAFTIPLERWIWALVTRANMAILRGYVPSRLFEHLLGERYRIEYRTVPTRDKEGNILHRNLWHRFTRIETNIERDRYSWKHDEGQPYMGRCPWSVQDIKGYGSSTLEEGEYRIPEDSPEDPVFKWDLRLEGRQICDRCDRLPECLATGLQRPPSQMKYRTA